MKKWFASFRNKNKSDVATNLPETGSTRAIVGALVACVVGESVV